MKVSISNFHRCHSHNEIKSMPEKPLKLTMLNIRINPLKKYKNSILKKNLGKNQIFKIFLKIIIKNY